MFVRVDHHNLHMQHRGINSVARLRLQSIGVGAGGDRGIDPPVLNSGNNPFFRLNYVHAEKVKSRMSIGIALRHEPRL